MKKKFTYLLLAVATIFVVTLTTSETNHPTGESGVAGSPSGSTCAKSGCHNSFSLNSGPGSLTMSSTMTGWEYQAGQTYTVTATVTQSSRSLFGICLEALDTLNRNGGTFTITNSSETQILTKTVGSVVRNEICHVFNGGAVSTPGAKAFSFNWTAPTDTTVNKVTFYFVGMAANGNGGTSGDYVYSTTQIATRKPAVVSGIDQTANALEVKVFPNPATNFIQLSSSRDAASPLTVNIYNTAGMLVRNLYQDESGAAKFSETFNVSDLQSGLYFVKLENGNNSKTERLFIK